MAETKTNSGRTRVWLSDELRKAWLWIERIESDAKPAPPSQSLEGL